MKLIITTLLLALSSFIATAQKPTGAESGAPVTVADSVNRQAEILNLPIRFFNTVLDNIHTLVIICVDKPGHKTYSSNELQAMPIRSITEITERLGNYGLTSFR